mmetsp:Transcript_10077/g.12408  ORF Transcript_10077/g.12408 Transcript_10077/m.12408 type:complete len:244 (+) Transcript_10077:725-1456(+)
MNNYLRSQSIGLGKQSILLEVIVSHVQHSQATTSRPMGMTSCQQSQSIYASILLGHCTPPAAPVGQGSEEQVGRTCLLGVYFVLVFRDQYHYHAVFWYQVQLADLHSLPRGARNEDQRRASRIGCQGIDQRLRNLRVEVTIFTPKKASRVLGRGDVEPDVKITVAPTFSKLNLEGKRGRTPQFLNIKFEEEQVETVSRLTSGGIFEGSQQQRAPIRVGLAAPDQPISGGLSQSRAQPGKRSQK